MHSTDERMCEVIGCGASAHWFVASEFDGQAHEQYLCHPHWRSVLANKHHHVLRWFPLNPHDDHDIEKPPPGVMTTETPVGV